VRPVILLGVLVAVAVRVTLRRGRMSRRERRARGYLVGPDGFADRP
jgi:hypothetical protein